MYNQSHNFNRSGGGGYGRSGKVYQDYTNSGIDRFEETDIYRKATNIGPRRVVEDNRPEYPDYQRRVVRNVEVPYNRQVKVPTMETQIVPSTTKVRVPVKKMVQVPSYKIVDEEYMDWEEQERVRDKEIWVKKIVQEKYVEKVPVRRVRQVRVPHKEVQEIEELEEVEVPTTKAVQVPGFRIDEVQDSKVVEVEEMENMRWEAEPTGEHQLVKTEDGPIIPSDGSSRRVGNGHYARDDPHVQHLPIDDRVPSNNTHQYSGTRNGLANDPHFSLRSHPNFTGRQFDKTAPMNDSFYNRSGLETTSELRPATLTASQPMRPLEEPRTTNGDYGWDTSYKAANGWHATKTPEDIHRSGAGEISAKRFLGMDRGREMQKAGKKKSKGLGMTVKSTATAHTDSYGVVVTRIIPKSLAAHAGLRENDVIVECNGRRTTTIQELGASIEKGSGNPLRMIVNRDGRRGQEVIVYQD